MHENGTLVANGSLVHAVVHYLMPQLMSISAGASRNTQRYASLLKEFSTYTILVALFIVFRP